MFNENLLNQLLEVVNAPSANQKEATNKLINKTNELVGINIEVSEESMKATPKPVKTSTPIQKAIGKEAIEARITQVVSTNTPIVLPTKNTKAKTTTKPKATTTTPKTNPFDSMVKKLIKLIDKFRKDKPERKVFHYVSEFNGTPIWSDTRLIVHLNKTNDLLKDYKLPEDVGKYPKGIKEIFDKVAETKLATIVSKDFKETIKGYEEEYIVIGKYVFSLSYLKTIANLASNFEIYGDPDKTLLPVKIKSEYFTGILTPVRASGESIEKFMKYDK